MMKKSILFMLLIAISLAGCSFHDSVNEESGVGEKKAVIGLLAPEAGNKFMLSMQQAFLSQAEELKMEVIIKVSSNVETQLNQANVLMTQEIDALVIWPFDGDAVVSIVETANEKQIPVFTYDTYANGGDVVSMVSTDNFSLGSTAARSLADMVYEKNREYKGNVAIVCGSISLTSHLERVDGFTKTMSEEYPDIRIVASQQAKSPEETLRVATDWLGLYGTDLDGIYSVSDYMTMAVFQAIEAMEQTEPIGSPQHIIILGTDAFPDVVTSIRDKKIDGTVAQNATEIGAEVVRVLYEYLVNGNAVEPIYYVPCMLITPFNINSDEVQEFGIWSEAYQ